jgi:hypothetical protein
LNFADQFGSELLDAATETINNARYLSAMIGASARFAIVKVVPRDTNKPLHRTSKEKPNAET